MENEAFSEHEIRAMKAMVEETLRQNIGAVIDQRLGEWGRRNTIALVSIIVAATIAWFTLRYQLDETRARMDAYDSKSTEWQTWREGVNDKLSGVKADTEWIKSALRQR